MATRSQGHRRHTVAINDRHPTPFGTDLFNTRAKYGPLFENSFFFIFKFFLLMLFMLILNVR